MNGPFFSERGILFPCLSFTAKAPLTGDFRSPLRFYVAQFNPLRAAHLAKATHGARHAMRQRAKRANKTRALHIRRALNRHDPAGLAQSVQHYLRRRGNRALRCGLGSARRGAGALGSARDVPCYSSPCSISICAHNAFLFRLAPQLTFRWLSSHSSIPLRAVTACVAEQSRDQRVCCGASSRPRSETPTALPDDFPSRGLHHRRADGPPDS